MSADEALHQLLAGNRRFMMGEPLSPRRSPEEFRSLAQGQFPAAVIVSCADSRVAPEILFDVGVGDIFVVRVAGNVVDGAGASVKGSIEYAIAELNVSLILVLGHSGCGAVKAAIQHLNNKDSLPGAINGLVKLIKLAVAKSKGISGDGLENAIRQKRGNRSRETPDTTTRHRAPSQRWEGQSGRRCLRPPHGRGHDELKMKRESAPMRPGMPRGLIITVAVAAIAILTGAIAWRVSWNRQWADRHWAN